MPCTFPDGHYPELSIDPLLCLGDSDRCASAVTRMDTLYLDLSGQLRTDPIGDIGTTPGQLQAQALGLPVNLVGLLTLCHCY